jgi:hypothetical protein
LVSNMALHMRYAHIVSHSALHEFTDMETKLDRYDANLQSANNRFGALGDPNREALRELTARHQLSVAAGDLVLLDRTWYVTHKGLLQIARTNHCSGIHTETIAEFCDAAANRWVVKATAFKTPRSKGFVGYGDANPSNVSPLVRGAELRIAETRAVNRALRKAYGIGICSVEELGIEDQQSQRAQTKSLSPRADGNASLRDRLLLLIRQHQLDSEQVKLYAANFCGTPSLREASREQIEHFVDHLTKLAADGREHVISRIKASLGQDREVAKTDPEPKEEQAA